MPDKIIISRIEFTNPRKKLYTLFDNNQLLAEVNEDTLVHFGISRERILSNKEFENIIAYDKEIQCRNQAYKYLQRKPYLKKELYKKLAGKHFTNAIIEKTFHTLERNNYINDQEYIKMFIRDAVKKAKDGPLLVRKKLLEKGADLPDVNEQIEKLFPFQFQVEIATNLLQKKMSKLADSESYVKKKKMIQYVSGRGFSWETIEAVFNIIGL
jgi:regulatory protein